MGVQTEDLRAMVDANRWGIGTRLRRTTTEGSTTDYEITALGEQAVVVKHLSEDIKGELLLYAAQGDTFTELVSRERIVTEVIGLSHRMTFLLRQLSDKIHLEEQ